MKSTSGRENGDVWLFFEEIGDFIQSVLMEDRNEDRIYFFHGSVQKYGSGMRELKKFGENNDFIQLFFCRYL